MAKDKTIRLSTAQVRWARVQRSGLVSPFASAEEAAARLGGIQAQILPAAALSLWNRLPDLTNRRFEESLYEARTLVKLWGQRGTLHLYASTDWPLICAARSVERTWWERNTQLTASELNDYHDLLDQIIELLRQNESIGRSDLRAAGLELREEQLSPWGGI